MHPVCIYRIFPNGNTDTAAGSTERDHKKYCRCKYISCNGTGGRDLSRVKMKELVDRDTIYYAFIRLVFIPLLVYVGCKLAGLDDLVTGVSVVLAAMPAASTTAIIASKYKKDEKFATRCVVSSTLLSLVTVPVWCLFLV